MVLDSSNTGIVGSNPAQGMNVRAPIFVSVLFCVGTGLSMGRSPVRGIIPKVKVKLSLCLTKHHDVLGEWRYSSTHS